MRKGTAAILALALTMGCLTACSDKPKETTMDPFAAQFVFATDSTGTVETAATTEPEPTEPFKGYKIVNIYLNGDLLAVRYYNTAGNVTREKYLGDEGYTANFEFDENGNLIKDTKQDVDGTMLSSHVYEYDASGNCTKKTYVNPDGSMGVSHVYAFDAAGFLVLDTETNPDGTVNQMVGYQNDAYGNPVSQVQKNTAGDMYEVKNEYEYDSNGNMTKWTVYRGGELNGTTENEYDAKGHLLCEKEYAPDGSLRSWIEYDYLDDGSVNSQTNYKNDGSIFQIIMYGYDSNGLAIETKYNAAGEIVEMYQFVYTY